MARVCPISGVRTRYGNNVSHANNKTRRRWQPNLQWKRVWVAEENRFVRLRISARGLRTVAKLGFLTAARKAEKGTR